MSADSSILGNERLGSQPALRAVWADWLVLFGLASVAELCARFLPGGPFRAIVALPPLLLLPGFALLSLALGRSRPRQLAMTGVFSLALSLGILMFDALVINAAGVRLSAVSLGFGALLVTGVLFALNALLGRPVVAAGMLEWARGALVHPGLVTRCLAVTASLAAGVGVVALVATHLPAPASAPFATLSLGSSWAARGSAPQVRVGELVSIPVVATSNGITAGQHKLTVSVDGTVVSSRSVVLPADGTWRGAVSVTAPSGPSLHRVVVSMAFGSSSGGDEQVVVYLDDDAA